MAETDVFERRLRAALVRHTDVVPNDFDALGFARLVAEKEPRRHGLGAVLGWRRAGVPQTAWVLLLVGLLAALAVGTLAVGTQLQRKAPAVVPAIGQVFECLPGSNPDQPGPADQVRPPQGATLAVAFDRRAGRLFATADIGGDLETWTFDVCTNKWSRMHPYQEPSGLSWSRPVFDVDSDVMIVVSYETEGEDSIEKVWSYDLETNTWAERGVAPTGAWPWAYDPVSGLVVANVGPADPAAPAELATYDVETDTWTRIHQANGPGWLWGAFAHDASVDRLVEFTGGDFGPETWLFDIRTGTWSKSEADTPVPEPNWVVPAIAYDEAAERTVVIGNAGLAAYDATSDRWEMFVEAASHSGFTTLPIAYDPVNRRLVGLGWNEADVGAFDLVTREWTVLLEPSEG